MSLRHKMLLSCAAVSASFCLFAPGLRAQSSSNPVTRAVRDSVQHHAKIMVAAAEEMPAAKYGFKPTSGQWSFGHLILHIAQSNNFACKQLGGATPPDLKNLKPNSGKQALVKALRQSFDYCSSTLTKVNDSNLNQQIPLWGGHKFSKAAVLLMVPADLADHYGAEAMYLRLNGKLPPTAQKKKM